MSTCLISRVIISGLALGVVSGCGASDDRANADEVSDRDAAQVAEQTGPEDPCSLITKEDAEAILGNPIELTPAPDRRSCDYAAREPTGRSFSVTVYRTDGKENLEVAKSAMSIAPQIMEGGGIETMGMMSLKPVEGLGVEAYYNAIAGSYVLKGNTSRVRPPAPARRRPAERGRQG